MTAEAKVKNLYPEAELRYGHVIPQKKWDWSTSSKVTIFVNGVWIGNICLAYGGKFEFEIWRRAWKQINKDMLKKLEI